MKTKSTITLTFLMLYSILTFGQTKEETLEWFIINGNNLSEYDMFTVRDKGLGTYNQIKGHLELMATHLIKKELCTDERGRLGRERYNSVYYYNLKDILCQDVNSLKIVTMTQSSEEVIRVTLLYFGTFKRSKQYENKNPVIEEITSDGKIYLYFENKENALRVMKAIMHMAKLSGAKENKQTF
jgi:hypothetical protein